MITSYLQGGLGNQMFQMSAACSLAWDNDDVATFDFGLSVCPLQGRVATNYRENVFARVNESVGLRPKLIYKEQSQKFSKIPYKEGLMLVGYFQSERYFKHNSVGIRDLFKEPTSITSEIDEKYGNLLKDNPTSIHVRHGDYWKYKDTHPPCPIEYYNKAMNNLGNNENYLVISDSLDWCKENFKNDNVQFVDSTIEQDYIDFYLMARCKNNIIANSSFSWWAAWLNNNKEKIVLYPRRWFGEKVNYNTEDLIPDTWEVV